MQATEHAGEPVEADRAELLEAAVDCLDEGIVVLDARGRVVFWNSSATEITGFQRVDLLARPCPEGLYTMQDRHLPASEARRDPRNQALPSAADLREPIERPCLVHLRHHAGHQLPAMLRRSALRDSLGHRIGTILLFHTVEEMDALPHGETSEGAGIESSQANMEDRLEAAFHDWRENEIPFAVMWITIDQARQLRRTHGREGCEAMLQVVEQTIAHGLRPSEVVGRWGDDEFLVLTRERTGEMLHSHAQHVAGLVRTADFRWWGDRVSLTASIGAVQVGPVQVGSARVEGEHAGPEREGAGDGPPGHAACPDSLSALLAGAQRAMQDSLRKGGNQVTDGRPAGKATGLGG